MIEPQDTRISDSVAARVRASFAAQSMMRTFEAGIDGLGPGLCRIVAPIAEHARQQHGYAHAALAFGLGDSAAGYAALTLLDEAQEVVTAEMKINLLAPAAGDRLVAEGRVIRPGRRLIVVQSDVWAESAGIPRFLHAWIEASETGEISEAEALIQTLRSCDPRMCPALGPVRPVTEAATLEAAVPVATETLVIQPEGNVAETPDIPQETAQDPRHGPVLLTGGN